MWGQLPRLPALSAVEGSGGPEASGRGVSDLPDADASHSIPSPVDLRLSAPLTCSREVHHDAGTKSMLEA